MNNWNNDWSTTYSNNSDNWGKLDRDQLLLLHMKLKEDIEKLKKEEIELRKYIVDNVFPEKQEGTNTLELGNGYELKAKVKYNYNLADNNTVEAGLDELSKSGNDGPFIAERLVSWTPNFLLTEYRKIEEEAENGSETAKKQLFIISKFMTKKEAAPELNIKEPKKKKG